MVLLAKHVMRKYLSEGYVILYGDRECMFNFMIKVGYFREDDVEPISREYTFIRKVQKFLELLKISEVEFKNLLAINAKRTSGDKCYYETYILSDNKYFEDFIERFVKAVLKF
jgi:hypothetical protein